jgi:RND superfamily putative drug exporter
MAGSEGGFARLVIRRRGWILAAWLAAAALLLPPARRVEERLDVNARVEGSESAEVERLLATRLASPFAQYAVLVATGVPRADTPAGAGVLRRLVAALDSTPGVAGTVSNLTVRDTLFVADEGTFLIVGVRPDAARPDDLVPQLRAVTDTLERALRATYPDARLGWTGEIALNFDLRRTSAADSQRAERRVLPLTAILLLLAFGSVAAALLPVAVGTLSIALALGVAALLAPHWPLSILLQNVVAMLGLGLGIDYALLIVSRFRESLGAGRTPEEAAEDAARSAGRTVTLSGATVAIGFAALLAVPLNELRSIAAGGLLVVTTSVMLATTLLPGVLAWLGSRVEMGRPRGTRDGWTVAYGRRWGRWVAERPLMVLGVAGVPVLLLAAQARRLNTELPRGDWLPKEMESARAVHALQNMKRSGVVQTIRVVVELPKDAGALTPAGWDATARLGDRLAADPRVARVRSLPASTGWRAPNPMLLSLLPVGMRRTFISDDGRTALIEVMPREDVAPVALTHLARQIRSMDVTAVAGLRDTRLVVGGLPAFNADYEDAVGSRSGLVIALIVIGTLVALVAGFRSLLVPIKAIVLNLLSVAAAFGAVVLVFQDGHGAQLLGLGGGVGAVFPAVPLIVFCIVFGLSMDYEVFLVARVAEARAHTRDETEALAEGVARTGGVITSAAAIMIAVFGAFTLGDFLLIKMLGFALAVAVFLDATIVRLAIGPAMLALAGRWNWWPGSIRGEGRGAWAVGGHEELSEVTNSVQVTGHAPASDFRPLTSRT